MRWSLSRAAGWFFSRNPGLSHFKPPVRVITLGVARNFILLDRALEHIGYGPPRNDLRWMLGRVMAFSLLFWRLKPSRVARGARRSGIGYRDLIKLRDVSPRDLVKGLSEFDRLSVLYSMPKWMLAQLKAAEIPNLEELLRTLNRDPNRWLRVRLNAGRGRIEAALRDAGVMAEPDEQLPDVLKIIEAPGGLPRLLDRRVVVLQDKASALVSHVLQPGGRRVGDLTGGAAIKASHMAWLGAKGVFSMDISVRRVFEEAAPNVKAMDVGSIVDLAVGDVKKPPIRGLDAVLVDPPCTDLGRLQFNPEIKMWLKPRDLRVMSGLQLGMMKAASGASRTLVYSVCTLTYSETIRNARIASEEFGLEPIEAQPIVGERPPGFPKAQRMLPHIHGTQGFFIAKFKTK